MNYTEQFYNKLKEYKNKKIKRGYKAFIRENPALLDNFIKENKHNPTNKEMYFKNLKLKSEKNPKLKSKKNIILEKTDYKKNKIQSKIKAIKKSIKEIDEIKTDATKQETLQELLNTFQENKNSYTEQERQSKIEEIKILQDEIKEEQTKKLEKTYKINLSFDFFNDIKENETLKNNSLKELEEIKENIIKEMELSQAMSNDVDGYLKNMTAIEKKFNMFIRLYNEQVKANNNYHFRVKDQITTLNQMALVNKTQNLLQLEAKQEKLEDNNDISKRIRDLF
jgi:hypothetical protein